MLFWIIGHFFQKKDLSDDDFFGNEGILAVKAILAGQKCCPYTWNWVYFESIDY